jgi:glycerol-3-phosphate dehydrogenase
LDPVRNRMIHVDVAIIGAGINGAGTARELSRRGYSVILVDKGDIGSGTSSASSKLLHGGIRYLEHGEFKLVFEACQERYHWIKNTPHLAKKQSFIIPIYRHHKRKKWMIRAGIMLYGLLSGFRQVGRNTTTPTRPQSQRIGR